MPRLSLYRPNKTNDYRFIDRRIHEMYTVGGLDVYVHKYLGPKVKGDYSTDGSTSPGHNDATQPIYSSQDPLNVEDLFLLENRDRDYDDDIYVMRGVYNVSDIDFDLTQFGLFLNNDTLFITFHYNDMIDTFGRKLMNGDVLELPNLKDYHPLDMSGPKALPKYYVIQDAAFASEGFSQTWLPHLWRVKATPMKASQEFDDILNKPLDPDNPDAGSIQDLLGTRTKDVEINDAVVAQAEAEVPLSGYDTTKFFILPTSSTTNEPGTESATSPGYTLGYLTETGVPPNGSPVTTGVSFPSGAAAGDYVLRLDYYPNRLFRYTGTRWVKVEDNVRTDTTLGPDNKSLKSGFVNNTDSVATTDRGNVPSRQSLSDALKPKADN